MPKRGSHSQPPAQQTQQSVQEERVVAVLTCRSLALSTIHSSREPPSTTSPAMAHLVSVRVRWAPTGPMGGLLNLRLRVQGGRDMRGGSAKEAGWVRENFSRGWAKRPALEEGGPGWARQDGPKAIDYQTHVLELS